MDESVWSDDSQLLDWQSLAFENADEPSKKVDVIRRQLAMLVVSSCHKNTNGLPLHFALELERLHREYSSYMDERDPSKGVNNYAEAVQALLPKHYTSAASKWSSSLKKDSFLEFGPVKEALNQPKLDFSTLKLRSAPPAQLLGQGPSPDTGVMPGSATSTAITTTTSSFTSQSAVALSSAHSALPTPPTPRTNTAPTTNMPAQPPSSSGYCQRPLLPSPPPAPPPPQSHGPSSHNPPNPTRAANVHYRGTAARGSAYSGATSVPNRGDTQSGRSYEGAQRSKTFQYPKNSQRKRQRGYQQHQEEEEEEEEEDTQKTYGAFITARDQFHINKKKKKFGGQGHGGGDGWEGADQDNSLGVYGSSKRSLGPRRGFVPPLKRQDEEDAHEEIRSRVLYGGPPKGEGKGSLPPELEGDERLKNIDPKMIELISNEIMDHSSPVQWSDIAGLERAKKTVTEAVIWPLQRPDLFTGLRGPPKGILLFGPPGTGKTLIGKCIANTVKATFFSISASSLTSKWVGEGEKMVRALFAVAGVYQPAVVFIDEIDSLLSQRSDSEHEASRRIKTEFLVQLDGAATSSEDRILVVGATNRPQEIDEAARRRLVKRLYIPLPDMPARRQIVTNLLKEQKHSLSENEMEELCRLTEGYSGADMSSLCQDAAFWPLRSLTDITGITVDQVRPITFEDFNKSLQTVKPSVSSSDLDVYIKWNDTYGS